MENKQTTHYEGAIIIRVYPSKNGGRSFALARARGMDLNIPGTEDATRYDVKIVQSTGCAFPNTEGIYRISFDGEAWLDRRKDIKYPTIWLRPMGSWQCLKSRDLHYSFNRIDGYNRPINFLISEREAGKAFEEKKEVAKGPENC